MFDCRCPHSFTDRHFAEAERAFSRRTFLAAAGAAGVAMLLPWRVRAAMLDKTVVLKAARMFDGTKLHEPGLFVVKSGKIVSFNAGDAGVDATVVDLGDATLMPGLIDAHTHVAARVVVSDYLLGLSPKYQAADNVGEAAIYSIRNAQVMLRNGFTTVRDVGGGDGIDLALRNAVANGAVLGPTIYAGGPSLSITGGHGDSNDLPESVHVDTDIETGVSFGPYGFRQKVREHVKRHVDHIKILATGGVLSYGDVWDVPQFNLDEIQAVVDEATKFDRKVAAHCHGDKGIAMAVEGGVHSIEHCTGVSEKTLRAMQQRGTHLVPTIWALDSILQPGNPNKIPAGSIAKAEHAKELRDAGMARASASSVTMSYGTDAGVFPHEQNNRDFALLVRNHGMRPIDALRAATANAADLIGVTDRGSLAVGKRADIVAFAGDPTRTIELMERPPALVMLGGQRIDLARLG